MKQNNRSLNFYTEEDIDLINSYIDKGGFDKDNYEELAAILNRPVNSIKSKYSSIKKERGISKWNKVVPGRYKKTLVNFRNTKYSILKYKEGNHIVNPRVIGTNNGLPKQTYYLSINANILKAKRMSDGCVFVADGKSMYSTLSGLKFTLTHLWENQDSNDLRVGGIVDTLGFVPSLCDLSDISQKINSASV